MRQVQKLRQLAYFVALSAFLAGYSPYAATQGIVIDSWAPQATASPVKLTVIDTGAGPLPYPPVHATLLPDGRVMLFGKTPRKEKAAWFLPTPFDQEPPSEVVLQVDNVPVDVSQLSFTDSAGIQWFVDETLFCSGHALTADGSIFVAGGTLLYSGLNPDTGVRTNYIFGLPNSTLYSFPNAAWSRVPGSVLGIGGSNLALRWYSTVTRLADSRMLITSGLDLAVVQVQVPGSPQIQLPGTPNRSVEIYSPSSGYSLVSSHTATPPEVWNPDYTHAFQVPYPTNPNYVLMFGQAGVPVYHAPDAASGSQWITLGASPRSSAASATPNHGTSSALLPLRVNNGEWGYANGSVLQAGGDHETPPEQNIDIFELGSSRWLPSVHMGVRRHHPSTVLLPDGKVLIVAGHDDKTQSPLVLNAQYLNPRPPAALNTGYTAMGEARGYHGVALLLPDGRVFVAGGRTGGSDSAEDEKPNFRYLYPPYMSPREAPPPRPTITSAPTTIRYGTNFSVGFSGGPISEAVLMSLGSMTHSFDANQRYVQLAMPITGSTPAQITAPPNPQTAPPGYYMLFLLDGNRVPSVARILRIGA